MKEDKNILKKKIFKILFFIPIIIFIIICNIPLLYKNIYEQELRNVLIGELSIIFIWFIFVYLISSIVAFIVNKNNIIDKSCEEKSEEDNNDIKKCDILENKVFEYSFENVNVYNAVGEALYFIKNKKKYLNYGKNNINNSFNQLIIAGIFTSICFGIINIKYLLLFSICFILLMIWLIKKNCSNRKSR